MKKDIHPNYTKDAKVICACGNVFETGSTIETIKTELCSKCHPFFTGKQRLVDTAQRVEKFNKKLKAGSDSKSLKKAKEEKIAKRTKSKTEARSKKEVKKITSK